MSEELLSNDRRVEKNLTPPGFDSRSITNCTALSANKLYIGVRAIEITQK